MTRSEASFDVKQALQGRSLCLVAGMSSAGKSTFIEHDLQPALGWRDTEIHFAGKLQKSETASHLVSGIVHYNLLLPYKQDSGSADEVLEKEPVLSALLEKSQNLHVFLIVCEHNTLEARISNRDQLEPRYFGPQAIYPKDAARARMVGVSQHQTAFAFGRRFEAAGALVTVLNSTRSGLVQILLSDIHSLDL